MEPLFTAEGAHITVIEDEEWHQKHVLLIVRSGGRTTSTLLDEQEARDLSSRLLHRAFNLINRKEKEQGYE